MPRISSGIQPERRRRWRPGGKTDQVHDDLAIGPGDEGYVPVLQRLDEVFPVVNLSVDGAGEVLVAIGVDEGLSSGFCRARNVHCVSLASLGTTTTTSTSRRVTHRHRRWRDVRGTRRYPFLPKCRTNRDLDNVVPWTFSRISLGSRRGRRWRGDNLGYHTWFTLLCVEC